MEDDFVYLETHRETPSNTNQDMDINATIAGLRRIKTELLDRVENIDTTIQTLESLSHITLSPAQKEDGEILKVDLTVIANKYADYDKNGSLKSKILYVLKRENRFLHVREIAKLLNQHEPMIPTKDWTGKISSVTSSLRSQNIIVKVLAGKSNINTFWGAKNWLDEKGNVKKEHLYDEKQLQYVSTSENIQF